MSSTVQAVVAALVRDGFAILRHGEDCDPRDVCECVYGAEVPLESVVLPIPADTQHDDGFCAGGSRRDGTRVPPSLRGQSRYVHRDKEPAAVRHSGVDML